METHSKFLFTLGGQETLLGLLGTTGLLQSLSHLGLFAFALLRLARRLLE